MNGKPAGAVHWSFWLICIVALVWNVMGAINFVVQMDPDTIASYRESERAIIESRPVWATAGFAVSVFGGTFGALLLLFRKPAAFYLFAASLLGTIATMIHTLWLATTSVRFHPLEIVGIIAMPIAVAAFLVWYSKTAERKGWVV